jgi:transposase
MKLSHTDAMGDAPIPSGISTEDWSVTPPGVRELVWLLLQRPGALEQQIAQLQERLNQHSGNSSKPPSSDPPNAPPRPKRTPSGRKAGGLSGHGGHTRPLKPLDQVQAVVELRSTNCGVCGALLLGQDPQPQRHQVTELPHIEPHVTEYRRHALTCLVCGAETHAEWPADMPSGDFGPRPQATTGYSSGRIGYGIVLEPADRVPAAIQKFEEQLATEQDKRGFAYTLQELDQRFQSFFTSLVESGSFTRGIDAAPSVDKETWLQAQQVAIGRLARGETT